MAVRITNEELLELTRRAFEKNEVAEFLCGENGYSVMGNRDIPANIPTDFTRIVGFGVYKLYLELQDQNVISKFRQAIMSLLNGSPVNIWCAYMAFWSQLYNEHSKFPTPFKIIDEEFLSYVKKSLHKNEQALKKCKKFLGENKEKGLWDCIVHLNNIAKEDYEVSVL